MNVLRVLLPIILLFSTSLLASAQQQSQQESEPKTVEECRYSEGIENYFFAGVGALIVSFALNYMRKSTTKHMNERFQYAIGLINTINNGQTIGINTQNFDANELSEYNSYKRIIGFYDAAGVISAGIGFWV